MKPLYQALRWLLDVADDEPLPMEVVIEAEHDPVRVLQRVWDACLSPERVEAVIEHYRLTPGPACAVSFGCALRHDRHLHLDFGAHRLCLPIKNSPELATHFRNLVPAEALVALARREA